MPEKLVIGLSLVVCDFEENAQISLVGPFVEPVDNQLQQFEVLRGGAPILGVSIASQEGFEGVFAAIFLVLDSCLPEDLPGLFWRGRLGTHLWLSGQIMEAIL